MTITLIGERRDEGYIFIHSPELKGFSLMLEPDEYDIKTFLDAVYDPLLTYIQAYHKALAKNEKPRLRSIIESAPMVAKLCFQ
ncbi:MAG: hypothetical protein ACREC0_12020 [Methylocella sp.]